MRGRFSPRYMGSLRSSSLLVPTSMTQGRTREGVKPGREGVGETHKMGTQTVSLLSCLSPQAGNKHYITMYLQLRSTGRPCPPGCPGRLRQGHPAQGCGFRPSPQWPRHPTGANSRPLQPEGIGARASECVEAMNVRKECKSAAVVAPHNPSAVFTISPRSSAEKNMPLGLRYSR
jgi:hypothetical protein